MQRNSYRITGVISLLIFTILLSSCEKALMDRQTENNPVSNFESLWNTADQKYSFFEYKGIDWNEVYDRYRPMISEQMADEELFDVLAAMLNELKDGHVNLVSPFNISRYAFNWYAPQNFDFRLLKDHYIGWDYKITGPLINTRIEYQGKEFGYIYYGSFSDYVESADIDYVLGSFYNTDGLIFDIRNNGGGNVNNIYQLASRFTDREIMVYKAAIKNGPGHEDFTEYEEVWLEPKGSHPYLKPVILLTNRSCFSAASFFTLAMRELSQVTVIGDTTGGGLGAPAGFELPNGWGYRFSTSRTITPSGQNFENGIPPDHTVWMQPEHIAEGKDDILEAALLNLAK
ncbi:MAG: S41 family peptidase [Bacteroidales bacterium]